MEGTMKEQIEADIIPNEDEKRDTEKLPPPSSSDKFFLCHTVFFLLGLCHVLPFTFFSSANNYWMHVFRNISDMDQSPENRTVMQRDFPSATLVANTIPSLIFGILNITHGYKFKIIPRILVTLVIEFVIFAYYAIMVTVDTDKFQVTFYASVLLGYAIIAGSNTINIVAIMGLYSRFPHEYMKTCLIGQGVAGVLGDALNIVSIFVFADRLQSATLMYFSFGVGTIGISLALTFVVSQMAFFNEYIGSVPQDQGKKVPGWNKMAETLYQIRLIIALGFIFSIGMGTTHTAITALVVSQQATETTWGKNYFSPVMTFLLGNVASLFGRFLSSYLPVRFSDRTLLIFSIIRTLIFVPCIWLCNAQPRHHLPVIFGEDYQYGLILALFMISNGYIINTAVLFIPERLNKEDLDVAYMLFSLVYSSINAASSPVGLLVVNVL